MLIEITVYIRHYSCYFHTLCFRNATTKLQHTAINIEPYSKVMETIIMNSTESRIDLSFIMN